MSTPEALCSELKLPINRPEYATITEIFFSALFWSVTEVKRNDEEIFKWSGRSYPQLCFNTDDREAIAGWPESIPMFRPALTGETILDAPNGEEYTQKRWVEGLAAAGITFPRQQEEKFAQILAASLEGTSGDEAKLSSTLPLTPTLALTQNGTGAFRKSGPQNVAQMVEAIYALGTPFQERNGQSAAKQLVRAAKQRMEMDPFLKALDQAVQIGIFPEGCEFIATEVNPPFNIDLYTELSDGTPFAWFRNSWNKVTHASWVNVIPARRWLDWASSVIRYGFAFSWLWEMQWNEAIARSILRQHNFDITQREEGITVHTFLKEKISERPDGLLKWVSPDYGAGLADINSAMYRQITISHRIYTILFSKENGVIENNAELQKLPVDQAIMALSEDNRLTEKLYDALNPIDNKPNKGLLEATRNTLKPRGTEVEIARDYYSLIRRSGGRYWKTDPTTEAIAVIASLTCENPGGTSNLGKVKKSLSDLGLKPDNDLLLSSLERAGLARGSADADEAVEVRSAF